MPYRGVNPAPMTGDSSMHIRIVPTQPEYFEALAALQDIIFADIPAGEGFTAEMFRQQVERFPEGQFTALAQTDRGEVVVGETVTMRTSETFDGDHHPYYFDFIGQGTLSTHDPNGEWLYGIDVGVHPDFRRMGIGARLYQARRELVRRLNLRGEIVAGLLPGYSRYCDRMTVDDYARAVAAGDLTDPTLTMQVRAGFRLRRLLRGYVTDPRSDNVVSLIVRENPDFSLGASG